MFHYWSKGSYSFGQCKYYVNKINSWRLRRIIFYWGTLCSSTIKQSTALTLKAFQESDINVHDFLIYCINILVNPTQAVNYIFFDLNIFHFCTIDLILHITFESCHSWLSNKENVFDFNSLSTCDKRTRMIYFDFVI